MTPFSKKPSPKGVTPTEEVHTKEHRKRYQKKYQLVETDLELPIQGQVKDPEDLYLFLKDLQDENVPKVIGGKRDLPRFNVRIRPKADVEIYEVIFSMLWNTRYKVFCQIPVRVNEG